MSQPANSTCRPTLSLVTPAFNEALNLPPLYRRLRQTLDPLERDWEWIVIDDRSTDDTFETVAALARQDARVSGVRLARNFGSHAAIACGLHRAAGDCAVVIAADLQDPPELLPQLLESLRDGVSLVWAARRRRPGESFQVLLFSRLYYFMLRRVLGVKAMPPTGADFFLLDRAALEAFRKHDAAQVDVLALIASLGLASASVAYDKQERLHGRSGWNLRKKLALVANAVLSFSVFPGRLFAVLGAAFLLGGLGLGAFAFMGAALPGAPPPARHAPVAAVAAICGLLLLMLGALGRRLWRAHAAARRLPAYLVEEVTSRP